MKGAVAPVVAKKDRRFSDWVISAVAARLKARSTLSILSGLKEIEALKLDGIEESSDSNG